MIKIKNAVIQRSGYGLVIRGRDAQDGEPVKLTSVSRVELSGDGSVLAYKQDDLEPVASLVTVS